MVEIIGFHHFRAVLKQVSHGAAFLYGVIWAERFKIAMLAEITESEQFAASPWALQGEEKGGGRKTRTT